MLGEISQIHVIKSIARTYGVYDMIVEVEAADMQTLEHVIKSEIQQIENIRSTITLLVMDHYSD